MPNPWKQKAFAFNKKRAQVDEKASDFDRILAKLPPGQLKKILQDEECAAILTKYGVTGG